MTDVRLIVGVAAAAVAALLFWYGAGRLPSHAATTANGARLAQERCASCHGADGNSPASTVPKLAGQDADYLYAQLGAFADGARASEVMCAIARDLSDEEMYELADFYARQRRIADPAGDPATRAAGERIFFDGTADAPACALCHGDAGGHMMGGGHMGRGHMGHRGMMMGMSGPVPWLDGQHADYLVDQLDRFARGERASQPMADIAAALSARDRRAVALYLAARR